ncbi:hypothetical protein VOI54_04300 [Tamlana sp. 2201CG12-4]|uniref:hypothetical protein n=1 Tax=Tamlana sp. 2201CG12-4 TaxID=3112582 RepID=UPI002DBBC6A0|nr:hypothetical protein [Tamlana sp. 2201CG12-4]MEC3906225.1 hypothetical protein [Tamlana sp. 2201CG12-4]
MKKITILFLIIFTLSCNDKEKLDKELARLRYNYATTNDKTFLEKAYKLLNDNEYFDKEIVNQKNLDFVFPIYFYLEKFSELEVLIEESKGLDDFTRKYSLNLITAYSHYKEGDLSKAEKRIKQNIEILSSESSLNPQDSILLVDLYKMKVHTNNYEDLINEVDSLIREDTLNSELFYRKILIPEINEYKNALPEYISNRLTSIPLYETNNSGGSN